MAIKAITFVPAKGAGLCDCESCDGGRILIGICPGCNGVTAKEGFFIRPKRKD